MCIHTIEDCVYTPVGVTNMATHRRKGPNNGRKPVQFPPNTFNDLVALRDRMQAAYSNGTGRAVLGAAEGQIPLWAVVEILLQEHNDKRERSNAHKGRRKSKVTEETGE
jgi:hypothetical protein